MNPSLLLNDTKTVLKELEQLSGFPVSFLDDPSLKVTATIKTGTSKKPVHLISYKPDNRIPDYQIAFEALLAIRMFKHHPEKRFHLAADESSRQGVIQDLQRMHPKAPADRMREMGKHLFDGLLLQLRSYPPGILVDRYIHENCPGLLELQALSLKEQTAVCTQTLSPKLNEGFPSNIVKASRAMNAAYALATGNLLAEPHLVVPFRVAGQEKTGQELLALLPTAANSNIDDRQLIMSWADRLGVSDWIKWLPFE